MSLNVLKNLKHTKSKTGRTDRRTDSVTYRVTPKGHLTCIPAPALLHATDAVLYTAPFHSWMRLERILLVYFKALSSSPNPILLKRLPRQYKISSLHYYSLDLSISYSFVDAVPTLDSHNKAVRTTM